MRTTLQKPEKDASIHVQENDGRDLGPPRLAQTGAGGERKDDQVLQVPILGTKQTLGSLEAGRAVSLPMCIFNSSMDRASLLIDR